MSQPTRGKVTGKDLKRLDKARKVVEGEGVKLNLFLPSGRKIWTVKGHDCEYLVDFESEKHYCSCDDFHFRVLSDKIAECYHLVAVRKAKEEEMYSVMERKDDDYGDFMTKLLIENFMHIS